MLKKINKDLVTSLKNGNAVRVSALRLLIAAIKNKEIEKRSGGKDPELTDNEIIELVGKEIKKRKEAAELYRKGGRTDLVAREEEETKELETYLPPQLSDEELTGIVKKAIDELKPSSAKDFGKIIGRVVKDARGRANSVRVSETIKSLLEKI